MFLLVLVYQVPSLRNCHSMKYDNAKVRIHKIYDKQQFILQLENMELTTT